MKKASFTLLGFLFQFNFLFSQGSPILSLDLESGIVDTTPMPSFDETIENGETMFSFGQFNQKSALLPQSLNDLPTGIVFTPRKRTAIDFEVTDFPIRTNVKIIVDASDGSQFEYSGSMVSKKHVLTSAYFFFDLNTNEPISYEISVCPAYDDGMTNPEFECCFVTKIHRFQEWNRVGKDFALLELEQDIGDKIGWIGIGFNNDNDFFKENLFHKFTYADSSILSNDPLFYNGDTLYHFHGGLNDIREHRLRTVNNYTGTHGEGGSSLIKLKNDESYTSYGVQNYISGLVHS